MSSTGSTLLHTSQAQPISQAARPLPQEESSDHIRNSSMSSTCASRRIYSRYTTALNPASFRIPNPRQNCELEELDFWTLHLAQHTESFCVYLWNLLCANSHSTAQKTEALLAQATSSEATLATLSRWDRKRHKVSNQERKQAANRPPRDRIKTEPFAFENPL